MIDSDVTPYKWEVWGDVSETDKKWALRYSVNVEFIDEVSFTPSNLILKDSNTSRREKHVILPKRMLITANSPEQSAMLQLKFGDRLYQFSNGFYDSSVVASVVAQRPKD